MAELTQQALEAAKKSLASTIRKNKKARETLSQKQPPRLAQMEMIARNLANLEVMLTLVEQQLDGSGGSPARPSLEAARQAIPAYIGQIEKVLPKFAPGTPQHTLAVRRIDAYHLADMLLERALHP